MKLPTDLIHKVQSEYIAMKYKDGVFTFNSLDEKTLSCIIEGFIKWSKENNLVEDGLLNIKSIYED